MKPTTIEPNTLGKKHLTQPFYETTKERIMNTIKLISAIVAGLTFGVSQADLPVAQIGISLKDNRKA